MSQAELEKEICKGCPHNNYPLCNGTILKDGTKMRIDNLRAMFNCGRKTKEVRDYSKDTKEGNQARLDNIESRLDALEGK